MRNILLGVTGSVAATLTTKMAAALKEVGDVRIIFTKCGKEFMSPEDFRILKEDLNVQCYEDIDEWAKPYEKGDSILHIELRRWAGCLVLAPLSANTLAKIWMGMADNLLTSVVRAWDYNRPIIAAPAMNTYMWGNEPTNRQCRDLKLRGLRIIDPVAKHLACDDFGTGAMADIKSIVKEVNNRLRWRFPLEKCSGIPINHHPGAFGFHRRKNHHTGVDLYCLDGTPVHACESGLVVKVDDFTGPAAGHDWWESTKAVMIEGPSGVINYGEITPSRFMRVGVKIERGELIGCVKRVLFPDKLRPDIPGHSCSMLHLELYKHGTREFADWHDLKKNPTLMDPTKFLLEAEDAPRETLTWDNEDGKIVG